MPGPHTPPAQIYNSGLSGLTTEEFNVQYGHIGAAYSTEENGAQAAGATMQASTHPEGAAYGQNPNSLFGSSAEPLTPTVILSPESSISSP